MKYIQNKSEILCEKGMNDMKNIMNGTYVRNDELVDFNFATDLSAYKKMLFVNYVVDSIVDEDRYDFIIKDLVFDFGLIEIMTDVDTSFINVEDEDGNAINPIIFIEQFLEETNIVDIVKANMEIGLLDELNNAVDKSIEYRTGIHPNVISDALSNLIKTIDNKVKEFDLDGMMDMAKLFTGMTEDFTTENIVNAYMESDIHKNNVIEIEESKKQRVEFAEDMDNAIKMTDGADKTKSKSKSKSKK